MKVGDGTGSHSRANGRRVRRGVVPGCRTTPEPASSVDNADEPDGHSRVIVVRPETITVVSTAYNDMLEAITGSYVLLGLAALVALFVAITAIKIAIKLAVRIAIVGGIVLAGLYTVGYVG